MFGIVVASQEKLDGLFETNDGAVDLEFQICRSVFTIPLIEPVVYRSSALDEAGNPVITMSKDKDCICLAFFERFIFEIYPTIIRAYPGPNISASTVEMYLLSFVISIWLEMRGIRTFHASSVLIENEAVVFLGNSGAGKSSLAGKFVGSGCPLVTDDILAIDKIDDDFLAYPSFPILRHWPDSAQHLFQTLDGFDQVNNSRKLYKKINIPEGISYLDTPHPISCCYVIERTIVPLDADSNYPYIEIKRLSPTEAVIALAQYSYIFRVVSALGIAAERFDFLSSLALSVPVFHLIYPDGFEYLDEVLQCIKSSLGTPERVS